MDALPPIQTTALDSTPTSLPARRPSRKKNRTLAHTHPIPQPSFSEKYTDSPITTTSSNPYDMHPPPPTHSAADLEAQSHEAFKVKPIKKRGIWLIILCVIIVWALFVFGVVMFSDTVFPGALEWRKMKMELVGTEKAVEVLRGKMGEMVRYIDSLGLADGMRGMGGMMGGGGRPGGNWTMGGLQGSGEGLGAEVEMDNGGQAVEGM